MGKFISKKSILIVLAFILTLTFILLPAIAQPSESETADVVLDGRQLFKISSAEAFSAQQRADWITFQLQQVVKSQKFPRIAIQERNQLPAIIVNDRYLFTITKRDIQQDNTVTEQAEIWSQLIRQRILQAQQERSFRFLWRASLGVILVLFVAIGLHWGFSRLFKRLLVTLPRLLRLEQNSEDSTRKTLTFALRFLLWLIQLALWVIFAFWATNLFPLTRNWSYRIRVSLVRTFIEPLVTVGTKAYSILDFFILMGLLFGLFIFANTVTNLLKIRVLRISNIERGIQEAIAIVSKYIFLSIGTIVILQVWGLDLSSLTLIASALGVGIGFGFQDIIKNFTSGFVLIFERSVQVGDFIQIGDLMGTVEHIGARSTEVRTLDQVSIIVPNSRFLVNEVINWSHRNPVSRIHLPVRVAYESDINDVKTALLDATKDYPQILTTPIPKVVFKGFGDSSLDFVLLVWIADPSKQPLVKSDLYFRLEASLRRHSIEIPFPQRDLHIRSSSFLSVNNKE
ncbi:MAG: mechanosensitive ion channel family protein [Microcystaceae cyanobacterium]